MKRVRAGAEGKIIEKGENKIRTYKARHGPKWYNFKS
jgi:hypothetical protein